MNHYDGPAFYRKFLRDGAVNKTNKMKALKKKKLQRSQHQRSVTDFSRDVQRRQDFGDFEPTKTDSSKIDLQNNPIARITAEFHPRRHYGAPNHFDNQTSNVPSEFQRINTHYRRLTSELTPSDDEVTLMANSGNSDGSSQNKGPFSFQLATSSNGNSKKSISSPFNAIHKTPVSESSSARSFVSRQEYQKSVNSSSLDQISDAMSGNHQPESNSNVDMNQSFSSKASNSVKSDEQISGSSNFVGVKPSNSDYIIQSSVTSKSSSTAKDAKLPLGHDFSSIMSNEDRAVNKNLTLFKKSKSDSEDSGASNNAVNSISVSSSSSNVTSNSSNDNSGLVDSGHNLNANGQSQSDVSGDDVPFNHRPDFAAQNPTNVQPSSDFKDSDSDSDEHPEIQLTAVSDYKFPDPDLLVAPKHYNDQGLDDWILNKAETLNKTLKAFNVNAQVVDWTNGPTVTQFQVKLHLGVKVSKINHLSDDLKMALAAKDIRIQAPIPGKTTCGIEIPNPKPRPVMLSEVVNSKTFKDSKSDLTMALGVDLTGKPRVTDLRKMPHGLIAGATGSGKSVFINCMLISLMYKATPQELKLILIDPKAVEFAPYNGIPYLLSPVISEPKQAAASLKWATKEMNERYEKLAAAGVRNIEQFNQKAEQHHQPQMKMPYIVIVIDELADLMMVAGDEIETYIVRITQKARAAGIHLIVATQRPSVDVITGTMKNNIPTRVAFMVSSQVDSRTIIDQSGAERLLGKGDMLYLGNGSSHPIRLQGCYVSNQEIDKVASFARQQEPARYAFHPGSLLKHVSRLENQDKLMPQVLAYIAKEKTVSTSKLQRVFSIGYNRSAKIIDSLEQHGYISGQEGSKPRDVYLTEKDYKKLNL